jgi:hypothetical protein
METLVFAPRSSAVEGTRDLVALLTPGVGLAYRGPILVPHKEEI